VNHRWLTTPGLLHARLLARPHGGDPVSHVRDGARPPAASALPPQRRPPSAGEPLGATRDRRRSSPSCCGTRPRRGCQSCSRLPSGRTARWCGIASEVSLWPEGEASRATRPRPDPAPLPLSLGRPRARAPPPRPVCTLRVERRPHPRPLPAPSLVRGVGKHNLHLGRAPALRRLLLLRPRVPGRHRGRLLALCKQRRVHREQLEGEGAARRAGRAGDRRGSAGAALRIDSAARKPVRLTLSHVFRRRSLRSSSALRKWRGRPRRRASSRGPGRRRKSSGAALVRCLERRKAQAEVACRACNPLSGVRHGECAEARRGGFSAVVEMQGASAVPPFGRD